MSRLVDHSNAVIVPPGLKAFVQFILVRKGTRIREDATLPILCARLDGPFQVIKCLRYRRSLPIHSKSIGRECGKAVVEFIHKYIVGLVLER